MHAVSIACSAVASIIDEDLPGMPRTLNDMCRGYSFFHRLFLRFKNSGGISPGDAEAGSRS